MKKLTYPENLIAILLALLGILAMAGWQLHIPLIIQVIPGMIGMVFNTALCFFLLGLALLLPVIDSKFKKAQVWLAYIITAIATLSLIANIIEVSTWLDQPELHTWLHDGNPYPGRMAPHTSIGLMLSGLILILMQQVKSRRIGALIQTGTLMVIAIGTISLTSYNFHLKLFFSDFQITRMAPLTAIAMIFAGIALWLNWSKKDWYTSRRYFQEDEKIAVTSVATLIIVVLCAGIAGFSVYENALEKSLTNSLTAAFNNRSTLIQSEIQQNLHFAQSNSIRLDLVRIVRQLQESSTSKGLDRELEDFGHSFLGSGFSGIQILAPSGKEILSLGKLIKDPAIHGGLMTDPPSLLLWDDGYYLRTRFYIFDQERIVGALIADRPLKLMSEQFKSSNQLGKTGTTVMCFVKAAYLDCFPERFNETPFRISKLDKFGRPLPMAYSEYGKAGIISAMDYRSHPVIAAYGQVDKSGLGLVIKQDAEELYSPISAKLQSSVLLFLVFITFAALVLHRQIKRMAAKLLASEMEAQRAAQDLVLKESLLRAVTDTMPLLTAFVDTEQKYRYCNKSYLDKFDVKPQDIIGKQLSEFLPKEYYESVLPYVQRALKGERCKFELPLNTKTFSLFIEGHYIPQISADGEILGFYAMLIDVTQTRQRERRLQHRVSTDGMTGLLNRIAFQSILQEQIILHAQTMEPLALLYLDIDHFKAINDKLGHDTGDDVIKLFASRIRKAVRASDKVARLGGDEFAILLPKIESEQVAEDIVRNLIERVTQPTTINGKKLRITTSIGIAFCRGGEISPKAFLNLADQALYEAKGAGRNNYKIKTV